MNLAALPMYDLPELRWATDALWRAIVAAAARQGLADLPAALAPSRDPHRLWADPDLVFAQSCGYPLTHGYRDKLRYLATPIYRAPGCEGPFYSSWILVRDASAACHVEDLRGTRAAVNNADSQSGMNVLRLAVAPYHRGGKFFSAVLASGAHIESVAMVAENRADCAAIDVVTYALLMRYRPQALFGTRRLCRTAGAPALPYVTRASASDREVDRLRLALFEAFADPAAEAARAALLIDGVEVIDARAYDVILEQERQAVALGYAELG